MLQSLQCTIALLNVYTNQNRCPSLNVRAHQHASGVPATADNSFMVSVLYKKEALHWVTVWANWTMNHFKKEAFKQLKGHDVKLQDLVFTFNGAELEDNKTLGEYGIKNLDGFIVNSKTPPPVHQTEAQTKPAVPPQPLRPQPVQASKPAKPKDIELWINDGNPHGMVKIIISRNATVFELKQKINEKTGIPIEKQKLNVANQPVSNNERQIETYNQINNRTTVFVEDTRKSKSQAFSHAVQHPTPQTAGREM